MPESIIHQAAAGSGDWREQLGQVIRSGEELLQCLGLEPVAAGFSAAAAARFELRVPRSFVARMGRGDPRDPLLLQVLASGRELEQHAGFTADPTGETGAANPRSGIIHKYRGRVLLIVTGACAVNCRYCFRRHFPYEDNQNSREDWRRALAYVAADTSISEVILSGGDPLLAGDAYLADLCREISTIPHVRRLRVHSRLPIVLPARVTAGLIAALQPPGLQTVMVVHCNHANEIDDGVRGGFKKITDKGMTLLNQSVLLADINDSVAALVSLSEQLFAAGALPYYLHLLDRVTGAAHLEVTELRARELHREISARLPGYLVPKLVRDVAGTAAKTAIAPLPPNGVNQPENTLL